MYTSRAQALLDVMADAHQAGAVVHADEEANQLLDFLARKNGELPENYNAVTLGDDIFVRPQYADNVRVLREELVHVFQQRAGVSTSSTFEKEIQARLMIIGSRQGWGITNNEVREMIQEIHQMRATGKY